MLYFSKNNLSFNKVLSHIIILFYCSAQNTALNTLQLQQQQQLLEQQLKILANSPFGDSPLFRNSLVVSGYPACGTCTSKEASVTELKAQTPKLKTI